MIGLSVLLIGATTTWFVCSGLVPAEKLGESAYPLYDAALATGKLYVIIAFLCLLNVPSEIVLVIILEYFSFNVFASS